MFHIGKKKKNLKKIINKNSLAKTLSHDRALIAGQNGMGRILPHGQYAQLKIEVISKEEKKNR